MKTEFDPGERERIDTWFEQTSAVMFGAGSVGKRVALTIEITDPAIASTVVGGLLYDKLPGLNLGFRVNAVHFDSLHDKEKMRQQLIEAVNNIFDL